MDKNEPDCFESFYNALKNDVSKVRAKTIYNEIEKNAFDANGFNPTNLEDHLNELKKNLYSTEGRKKFESVKRALKVLNAKNQMNRFHNTGEGLAAWANGINSNIEGSADSINNHIKIRLTQKLSKFIYMMKDSDVDTTFENKEFDAELGSELEKKNTSDNPKIKRLSTIIHSIYDSITDGLNNEGAEIKKTENFIASLNHNSRLMKSATGNALKDLKLKSELLVKHKLNPSKMNEEYRGIAYNRWRPFAKDRLNADETFGQLSEKKIEDFLKGSYEALTSNKFKTLFDEEKTENIYQNMAERLSAGRKLIFKTDGKSWGEYNKIYGYGTIHDAVLSTIEQGSRALAIIEKMGPTPSSFFSDISKWAELHSRNVPGAAKHIQRARNGMKVYLGQYDDPVRGLGGQIINTMRAWTYATKMGSVTLSSIPDFANMASAMRDHQVSSLETYRTILKNYTSGMPKGEMQKLSMLLGVYGQGTLGSIFDRFGDNVGNGFFARSMKLQNKLTMIHYHDNNLRSTMGMMLSHALTSKMDIEWDNLHPAEQRTLLISNVGEHEWDTIRLLKNRLDTYNDNKFLVPDDVDSLKDTELEKYRKSIGKKDVSVINKETARERLRDALQLYFTDQTNYGKIMPDASDIAFMQGSMDPHTTQGQVWKALTMFKSFSVAQTKRIGGRFIYGGGAQNLYEALIEGKGNIKGLVHWGVNSIPMTYLSLAAKAVSIGMLPPSLKDKKTWLRVLEPLGFVYLETAADMLNSNNLINSPVITTAKDVFNFGKLVLKSKDQMRGRGINKRTEIETHAINLASSNTLVVKTFYTNFILQHLIWNALLEKADPGYLYKRKNRSEQAGNKYFISPTEYNL